MNITITITDSQASDIQYAITNKIMPLTIENDTIEMVIQRLVNSSLLNVLSQVIDKRDREYLEIIMKTPAIKTQIDAVIAEEKLAKEEILPVKG